VESKIALKNTHEILQLYTKYGSNDYIGEPVSQIEHMCQCAELAQIKGHDDEVILAAFFHDIGHLLEHVMHVESMNGYGIINHEKLGANYLAERGFSERVTKLVASHVQAKRYLTYKSQEYYNRLSDASKKTLTFQGGVMSEAEANQFEGDELFNLYISLRNWDEAAKQMNKPLPDLNVYKQIMIQHLLNQ
jgi:phosphonate degradation associated HDIG domain protein